jgi:hypothetical protein
VRKVSAELQFYNTKHLKIDGYNIPFREVGGTLLNASVNSVQWNKTNEINRI